MLAGATVTKLFTTKQGGGPQDADSLPSVVVFRNEIATAVVATVTNVGVGQYSVQFEVPLNWVDGDSVNGIISATISGSFQQAPICFGAVDSVSANVAEINEHTQPIC